MSNRYELEAREAKVHHLVAAIDHLSKGIDANRVHAWAKQLTDEQWASISVIAAVKLPSETTRKQVVSLLERRTRIAQIGRAS